MRQGPRGEHSPLADESDVEDVPDRFDAQGRPLDESGRRVPWWTSRSGSFQYQPRHPGDWNVRGGWGIGGTDPEVVERLVHDVTGVLEGRGSWLGMLRDVFAAPGHGHQERIEDESQEEPRRRRKRRE